MIEENVKLCFYYVKKNYIDYLQKRDIAKNGFTRVPNMDYGNMRERKFACGIVLKSEFGLPYIAPVSSKKDEKANNIVLYNRNIDNPGKEAISSVRLNYMFPVPLFECEVLEIQNISNYKYATLIDKELLSANEQKEEIIKLAKATYQKVNKLLKENKPVNWACNFVDLEQFCKDWIKNKTNYAQECKEGLANYQASHSKKSSDDGKSK